MNTETKKYYESLIWTNGVGNGTKTACVNSLAVLMDADRRGLSREQALGEFSDNSSCICPVIRRLSIRINDRSAYWPNKDEATAWMHATAPRLLDTKGSVKLTRKRAYLCADAAVREIATYYFDRLAERKPEFREWADKLRACDPVVDTRTSRAAQAVANEARKAADAYADAAAAAAAAVDAVDAYAAYADAANKHMILALLDRLIACKE
jgi:hypothetical protein